MAKKDISQDRVSTPAKKGAKAVAVQAKSSSQDGGEKKTRIRKTPDVSQVLGADVSEDARKKRDSRAGLAASASAPKKAVKRVSSRSPGASVQRAAGMKKGARMKKGGAVQPPGDVGLKNGRTRNKKVKAQASIGSTKKETRARTSQVPVVRAAAALSIKKRGRKKRGGGDSSGVVDQLAKSEESNKRRKISAELPRSPSRRPGLRNSDNHEEPISELKRKSRESEGAAPAKKRKVGNKGTVEESTNPGNGIGPRRSSRNVKPESGNPPSHTMDGDQDARVECGAALVDGAKDANLISSELPEEAKEIESGLVQEDQGSKEGSEAKLANIEPDDVKERNVGAGDEKNRSGEAVTTGEKGDDESKKVHINRAPVITLWVAVVGEREGFKFDEGLSFGKAIAGMYAQAKGKRLGIFEDSRETQDKRETRHRTKEDLEQVEVFGTKLSAKKISEGHILAVDASGKPISPPVVLAYLKRAFGPNFDTVKGAMEMLARRYSREEVGRVGYNLYEKFRPAVPEGGKGWGAKGLLDLAHLAQLKQEENAQ
eukprot:TRINITY_DN8094_c0_g1_i1.p1 TRINITY_DN8094_c0_g1~~TRINITY_DN8094_c0_g1_i1.p1  ORF type:complete len:622 (-),score=154.55 TRINITY_DN8094_c0_g1_i1:348-1976(-)